ncbi:MAG: hypothetical protein JNM25_13200 [Planctomycetes bacterium]|nr:hypothetical protein [Planctomycetota bacterium]
MAFVALLWMPTIQGVTGVVPAVGLDGVEAPPQRVGFDLPSWSDGSWQSSWEASFDHDLGLRDWMVRIDNELRMRVFGVAKRPVVLGPDSWLMEAAYLPTLSLVQHRSIAERLLLKCYNLRRLQDAFAARGVTLVVLVSPGKGDSHPERMSREFRIEYEALRGVDRHYDVVKRGLTMAGVNFVDCVQLAKQMREQPAAGEPPMFVRGGIHWTNYGAARCAVALLDQIERASGTDVKSLDVTGVRMEPAPDRGELDIAYLANVLDLSRWRHPHGQPVVEVRQRDVGRPVGLLFVGTSFVWGLTHALKLHGVTDPLTVFYYYRSRTDFVAGEQKPSVPLDRTVEELHRELPHYQVVVLESNQVALMQLGHGFIEKALEACGLDVATTLPVSVETVMGHGYDR